MTEIEKAKAGQPYDEAKLWAEMDDDDVKAMVAAAMESGERNEKVAAEWKNGDLVPTDSEEGRVVTGWLKDGCPGLRGVQEGHNIIEKRIIVKPTDPLFWMAIQETIEERGWTVAGEP